MIQVIARLFTKEDDEIIIIEDKETAIIINKEKHSVKFIEEIENQRMEVLECILVNCYDFKELEINKDMKKYLDEELEENIDYYLEEYDLDYIKKFLDMRY